MMPIKLVVAAMSFPTPVMGTTSPYLQRTTRRGHQARRQPTEREDGISHPTVVIVTMHHQNDAGMLCTVHVSQHARSHDHAEGTRAAMYTQARDVTWNGLSVPSGLRYRDRCSFHVPRSA
jgi:hypothetical protein